MQRYEYLSVPLDFTFGVLSKGDPDVAGKLRPHAEQGWRLVQILEPARSGGETYKMIAVMERPLPG